MTDRNLNLTDRNLNGKNRRSTAYSLSEMGRLALSSQQSAPSILESAAAEAERLDHHYAGTEHTCCWAFRVNVKTAASRVLIEKGLDIDAVRGEIARLITEDYLE